MKEYVIRVPEKKTKFFLELIQNLGFIEAKEKEVDFEIPEEHKNLVRQRIKSAKSSDILDWDIAKKKIKIN